MALRRLDLRDDHVNPDGVQWRRETHKHRWSVADANSWAYTPNDIPHDGRPEAVGPDNYRAIFEAFAAECQIGFGPNYNWNDPTFPDLGTETLWRLP